MYAVWKCLMNVCLSFPISMFEANGLVKLDTRGALVTVFSVVVQQIEQKTLNSYIHLIIIHIICTYIYVYLSYIHPPKIPWK